MNALILLLQDGIPCLVYDEPLPHPVQHVEFSRASFQVTLVYEVPPPKAKEEKIDPFKARVVTNILQTSKIAQMVKTAKKEGRKLEYPLGREYVKILEEQKSIAIGVIKAGQLTDVKKIPVIFTNT